MRALGTLVAVVCLTLVGCTDDPPRPEADRGSPWPTTLPTSEWEPGDDAMQALGSGRLGVDADGCPYLAPEFDERIRYSEIVVTQSRYYVVWPAGWTATTANDGRLELHAAGGSLVATAGDIVQGGGGFVRLGKDLQDSCIPRESWDEVFYLQDGLS